MTRAATEPMQTSPNVQIEGHGQNNAPEPARPDVLEQAAQLILATKDAKLDTDQESDDIFTQLTSHMMSVQSLLNKHSNHARKTWQVQQHMMLELQKENQQLKDKLEQVLSACLKPAQELLGISPASAYSVVGETGGSVSNAVDILPPPPTPPDEIDAKEPGSEPPGMPSETRSFVVSSDDAPPRSSLPPGYVRDTHEFLGVETVELSPALAGARHKAAQEHGDGQEQTSVSAESAKKVSSEAMAPTTTVDSEENNVFNMDSDHGTQSSWRLDHVVRRLSRQPTSVMTVDGHPRHSMEEDLKMGSQLAPKPVFADAAAMKERVRQAIGKPEYNVFDYYKESGPCSVLAKNRIFEVVTLSIIAFNACWIAWDSDKNDATVLLQAEPQFIIAENFFCAFFLFEILIRFGAFEDKRCCMKDAWFVFDSFLVAFMVLETWMMGAVWILTASDNSDDTNNMGDASILRLLRLLRLTRMARMARLLRVMPELMILIKGMVVAMRSVFFTLCLLGIIIYLFAIAFRQLTNGTEIGDRYFRTIPDSMASLLLRGTLPDVADIVFEVSEEQPLFGVLLCTFILLASLTVMNMLVGVLCEVVSVVSSVEKEQLVVNFVQGQLRTLLIHCVGDSDKPMSKNNFTDLLGRPQAARALHEVGVDVLGLMEIADFLFKDDKKLSFPDFMEMVLELRGSNTATVKHIVDLQRFVHLELRKTKLDIEKHMGTVLDSVESNNSINDDQLQNRPRHMSMEDGEEEEFLIGIHGAGGSIPSKLPHMRKHLSKPH
jgi:voltage-gated sodium channel